MSDVIEQVKVRIGASFHKDVVAVIISDATVKLLKWDTKYPFHVYVDTKKKEFSIGQLDGVTMPHKITHDGSLVVYVTYRHGIDNTEWSGDIREFHNVVAIPHVNHSDSELSHLIVYTKERV